jgi:hypothetical protein
LEAVSDIFSRNLASIGLELENSKPLYVAKYKSLWEGKNGGSN